MNFGTFTDGGNPAALDYIAGYAAGGGVGSNRRWLRSTLANPPTDDGMALGTLSGPLRWSDIFLASGAVLNFASGDVLITHASDQLLFTGAASGYIFDGPVRSAAPTGGGFGYNTGAGGAVTQATNKSTAVTLNAICGQITMSAAALAANTLVQFTFNNSNIASTDQIIVSHITGGTIGAYNISVNPGSGSGTVNVRNITAGSLSESVVIAFIVFKSVTS